MEDRLKRLADYLDINDAFITASSDLVSFPAKQVRMENSLGSLCAWVAKPNDPTPWVQFDMEQDVTVWGVDVRPGCDSMYVQQRITSLKVSMSGDQVKWNDVTDAITIVYENNQHPNSLLWFDEVATARNWRIYILDWEYLPSMKADFLGQPIGKPVLFPLVPVASVLYHTVYANF